MTRICQLPTNRKTFQNWGLYHVENGSVMFCNELDPWFIYLERSEMKSPKDGPFLAQGPHVQPDRAVRAWGMTQA